MSSPKLKIVTVKISNEAFARNLWYIRELPKLANAVAADIVHLSFPAPIRKNTLRCPVVVSLHDLYPYDEPNNFGFPKVFFNRVFLHQCLREVDCVVCVSETTLTRLKTRYPRFAHRKSVVVHNCVTIDAAAPARFKQQSSRFVLMVAQHRVNKNIPLALRAFEELRGNKKVDKQTMLLLVGNQGPETPAIRLLIKRLELEESVRLVEKVSDGELRWLYDHCECLIAPSFTEGFGLPVVEGLVCKRRVVCSNITAFREIGGDACHYFDLHAESVTSAMVAAMYEALSAPIKAAKNLERFSVARVTKEYATLYRQLRENSADVSGSRGDC